MNAELKDAQPGERWRAERNGHMFTGEIVRLGTNLFLAYLRHGAAGPNIDSINDLNPDWRKTHNADGTVYQEPKPLPGFGECWAARDENGKVDLYDEMPKKGDIFWYVRTDSNEPFELGNISFLPELPWNKTACKVRVRLEVI